MKILYLNLLKIAYLGLFLLMMVSINFAEWKLAISGAYCASVLYTMICTAKPKGN